MFRDITGGDLAILRKLADLSSYDVYSLRISLRELEIPVNDYAELSLSEHKKQDLDAYMKRFTRPLMSQVYGEDEAMQDATDVIALFRQPDVNKALEKLNVLAGKLNIQIFEIPTFLQDYGDIYLSISYFRQCLEHLQPLIADLLATLKDLTSHPQLKQDRELMQTCGLIQSTVDRVNSVIAGRFEHFEKTTEAMWRNIDADRFHQVQSLIESNHATLGGLLCGLTVSLDAWTQQFPEGTSGGAFRRAEYVRFELRQAVDNVRKFAESGANA